MVYIMFDAPITDKFDSAVTCFASELQIGIIIQCGIAACMIQAVFVLLSLKSTTG